MNRIFDSPSNRVETGREQEPVWVSQPIEDPSWRKIMKRDMIDIWIYQRRTLLLLLRIRARVLVRRRLGQRVQCPHPFERVEFQLSHALHCRVELRFDISGSASMWGPHLADQVVGGARHVGRGAWGGVDFVALLLFFLISFSLLYV